MITKNGLITLTQVSDGPQGPSGEQYILETSQQEIIKLVNSGTSSKGIENITFEPNLIQIRLLKKEKEGYLPQSININNFSLYLYFKNGKQQLINQNYINPVNSSEINLLADDQNEKITDFNNALYIDSQNDCYLNLQILCYNLQQFQNEEAESFLNAFIEDCLLNIVYIDTSISALAYLPVRYGTTWDMASFNIEATKLLGKVQDNTLQFDATGLSLVNGGITLYKDAIVKGQEVFYVDANTKELVLKGTVYADSGEFTGTIHANEGTIGGLILKDNTLTSADGQSLTISGQTGVIKAQNIELGTEATIQNYIKLGKLGNAFIKNPDTNEGVFIEAGESIAISEKKSRKTLQIFDSGLANFGNITIDGPNSEIRGANFSITPNQANFSNINCSGAIETVVFKKNSIQAAGGTMIFRPSYKIVSIKNNSDNETIITLEEEFMGKGQTAIWLVENNNSSYVEVKVEKIAEDPNKLRTLSNINTTYNLLIDIGPVENSENDSFIMGINAGNSSVGANEEILPRGLTVRGKQSTPSLFLGDLSTPQIKAAIGYGTSGYGLYCDNVYLRGSLVTNSTTGKTAGVNTTSGVTGNENVGDDSPIIFWAGADGITGDEIRKAPFQVTENGAVRAMQAIFSDSVFAGGEIKSSSIRAAKIYGDGPEGQPALSIYDTTQGITFYDENEIETFSIGSNSFVKDGISFIDIGEKDAQFFGCFKGDLITENGKIYEEDGLIISYNEELKISIDSNASEIYGNIKFINTETGAKSIEYRQVSGGYDIYIA